MSQRCQIEPMPSGYQRDLDLWVGRDQAEGRASHRVRRRRPITTIRSAGGARWRRYPIDRGPSASGSTAEAWTSGPTPLSSRPRPETAPPCHPSLGHTLTRKRLDRIKMELRSDPPAPVQPGLQSTSREGEIELIHWTSRLALTEHKLHRHHVSGGRFQGLDEFDGDTEELAALDDCDGDLTRLHLDSWLKSYQHESAMFASLAVFIEVKLREIQQASRGGPVPNAFRTAVCCDMMLKLCSTLGNFSSAFAPLVTELFGSIYDQFDGDAASPFQATPFFIERNRVREQNSALEKQLQRLLDEVNMQKARSAVNRGGLESVIRNWQSSILSNTFRQWRSYVIHRKDKIDKLSRFFRKTNTVKDLFLRWRTITSRSASLKLKRLVQKHHDMVAEYEERLRAVTDERDLQKLSLQACLGKLNVAEADVFVLRKQVEMTTDEVVHDMKAKMVLLQIEYYRFAIGMIGERLRACREAVVGLFQHEWLCDAYLLVNLGEDGFSDDDLLGLVAEDAVLRWVNLRLRQCKDVKVDPVHDLSVSFQNGEVLVVLLSQLAPTLITLHSLDDPDPKERLKDALQAAAEIGANDGPLAMVADVFENKADLTFVLLARLMALVPGLHPRKQAIASELEQLDAVIHNWERLRRSRKGRLPAELAGFTAHVDHIVAQTQLVHDRLLRHHRIWEAILVKVSAMACSMLAARMRGEPIVVNDARENADMAQYRSLVSAKIERLIPSSLSPQEELLRVQTQLDRYAIANRRIFRHYAAGEGVGSTMSINEFVKFVQDAKLVGKTLKMPQVEKVFQLANSDDSVAGARPVAVNESSEALVADGDDTGDNTDGDDDADLDVVDNPDEELIPREFVECLVRLAVKKFAKPPSVADRFVLLMENFVLKNAMRSERFREELCSVKVKDVLDRYKACLRAIFRYYAAGGRKASRKRGAAKDDSMSLDEFRHMVQECAWVDATFSLAHVQSIFGNIQRMEEEDSAEVSTELVYDEFIEGIAAIAVMKIPNPYVEIDTRIEDFIQSRLLAPLVKLNLIPGLKKLIKAKKSVSSPELGS